MLETLDDAMKTDSEIASLYMLGTFTLEPLGPSLTFWQQKLGWEAEIEYGPYNQIFQQLSDPASKFFSRIGGANILLLRLQDWGGQSSQPDQAFQSIERNCQTFIGLVERVVSQSQKKLIILVCPSSPDFVAKYNDLLGNMERDLVEHLSNLSLVQPLLQQKWQHIYPVNEMFDSRADEVGHMPYTEPGYCQLATVIARCFDRLSKPPKKVVVLDCDETLWGGVCGEDTPENLTIDAGRLHLHYFMLAQRNSGMLLCIVSKNTEEDVLAVFSVRADMGLSQSDITLHKINWAPKSQNISELAAELNLGVDSFVFVDDNPVEIAEVNAALPMVESLCIPKKSQEIEAFLSHSWIFDSFEVTNADKQRAQQYSENLRREKDLAVASSLGDFIDGLNLEIKIEPVTLKHIDRCAQLTQRTNQFNFTTVRRNESEISQLVASDNRGCLMVHVKDRFGDYGLVGLAIFIEENGCLAVDTFLLSCRVLSRGVEFELMAELGRIAQSQSCSQVSITYSPTAKNQPAYDFFSHLAQSSTIQKAEEGTEKISLPSSDVSKLVFEPDRIQKDGSKNSIEEKSIDAKNKANNSDQDAQRISYAQIAESLNSVDKILEAVSSSIRVERADTLGVFLAPDSELEESLANIWQQTTQVDRVGRYDNFFALGGTSLQATQALARIAREFDVSLGLREFFASPTIATMALTIEEIIISEIENNAG